MTDDASPPADLLFVNKHHHSKRLSNSHGLEKKRIFSHVQKASKRAVATPIASFQCPHTMRISSCEVARTYFFRSFPWIERWAVSSSHSQSWYSMLDLAVCASGSAALNGLRPTAAGAKAAAVLYQRALAVLNASLGDVTQSKSDVLLIAITVLGYYENFAHDSVMPQQAWKAHLGGLEQLLKLRGRRQLRTDLGRELFQNSRATTIFWALNSGLCPPIFLWQWETEDDFYTPPSMRELNISQTAHDATHRLTVIAFDLANLQARIRTRDMAALRASVELEGRLDEVEQRLCRWREDLLKPESPWEFSAIDIPESPDVWQGRVHYYRETTSSRVWNMWRMQRVILARTRRMLVQNGPFGDVSNEHLAVLERVAYVQQMMADEVCASVPLQLSHSHTWPPSTVLNATRLLMPLVWAAMGLLEWKNAECSDQAMWIVGRLEYMATSFGIQKASTMAERLRSYVQDPHDVDRPWEFPLR